MPIPDLAIVLGLVIFAFLTNAPYVVHGQPWADGAMFFHFGHKLLVGGKIPFRDYVFQVGPLPIYVDALFQRVFGPSYLSSLWAALAVKTVLASILYWFAARWVGRLAGVLLAIFLLLDPTFCAQHHWSTPYALAFALLATYSFARAHELPRGSPRTRWLISSGAFVSCIVTARQSGAIAALCAVALVTVVFAIRSTENFDRRDLGAFWAGVLGLLGVLFLTLALQGALGATLRELFLDAPVKKSVLNL